MVQPRFGLCDSCRHQQLVQTTRGSVFSLCLRSRTDPAYPRYPRVPVVRCAGHEPRGREPRAQGARVGDDDGGEARDDGLGLAVQPAPPHASLGAF